MSLVSHAAEALPRPPSPIGRAWGSRLPPTAPRHSRHSVPESIRPPRNWCTGGTVGGEHRTSTRTGPTGNRTARIHSVQSQTSPSEGRHRRSEWAATSFPWPKKSSWLLSPTSPCPCPCGLGRAVPAVANWVTSPRGHAWSVGGSPSPTLISGSRFQEKPRRNR
jgi:hypothetical protein